MAVHVLVNIPQAYACTAIYKWIRGRIAFWLRVRPDRESTGVIGALFLLIWGAVRLKMDATLRSLGASVTLSSLFSPSAREQQQKSQNWWHKSSCGRPHITMVPSSIWRPSASGISMHHSLSYAFFIRVINFHYISLDARILNTFFHSMLAMAL